MSNAKQRNVTKLQNGQLTPQGSGDDVIQVSQQGLSGQWLERRDTTQSIESIKPAFYNGGYATEPTMMDYRRSEPFPGPGQYASGIQSLASPPPPNMWLMSDDELNRYERQMKLWQEAKKIENEAAAQARVPQPESPPPQPKPSRRGHTYGPVTIEGPQAELLQGNIYTKDINPQMRTTHQYSQVKMVAKPGFPPHQKSLVVQGDMTSENFQATFGGRRRRT